MPALAPLSEIIRIKPRPETTLSLSTALANPAATVANYVFTAGIRDHFDRVFGAVQGGRGQGFWVQGEYAGGKTHFLATLAALLTGGDTVWDALDKDEGDVRTRHARLRNTRLFPVVFSLRGEAGAGAAGSGRTLYDVLEAQIEAAARTLIDADISLTSAADLIHWYEELPPQMRAAIDSELQPRTGMSFVELRYRAGDRQAADVLAATASALTMRPAIAANTRQRLRHAYHTVTAAGNYAGMLVVIDEFAFWQDQHPQGGREYAHDEEVLETMAWTLRVDDQLPVYTVVASQKAPPVKLAGAYGGRFEVLDVLKGDNAAAKTRDYQRIVSRRVRELRPGRELEAQEYFHHYEERFEERFFDELQFLDAFPIERHAYEILQLLTQSLAAERVGINVIWEVLGRQTDDPEQPEPSELITGQSRLVIAADLLNSPTLQDELRRGEFSAAVRARDALLQNIQRLPGLAEEREFALVVAQTLFLWYIANRRSPRPMTLQQLAEAALIEGGILGEPTDAVINVLDQLHALAQIEFDPAAGTAEFKAAGSDGIDPALIYQDYFKRETDQYRLQQVWDDSFTDANLRADSLTAAFNGLAPDQAQAVDAEYGKVLYRGESLLATSWEPRLGELAGGKRSNHFRIVYLRRDLPIAAEQLLDPRVAVVIPGARGGLQEDALRRYAAFASMRAEMEPRSDAEALSCQRWLRDPARTREIVAPLLQAQRTVYRTGAIISRDELSLEPLQFFDGVDAEPRRATRIAAALLSGVYVNRPLGIPAVGQPIKGQVAAQLFTGLFAPEAGRNADKDAVRNYGPALGLSNSLNALRFDPARCPAFVQLRDLRERAGATNGASVPAAQIYDRFWRLGVPEEITTLFLLAFVYTPNEHAELLLKPEDRGKVKLREGGKLPSERITAAIVKRLDFGSLKAEMIDSLAPRQGVAWREALSWLQLIEPRLSATDDFDEITRQGASVVEAARTLAREANEAVEALTTVAGQLRQSLPPDVLSQKEQIGALASAQTYEQLWDLAHDTFADEAELKAAVEAARRLDVAQKRSVQLQHVASYLDGVPAETLATLDQQAAVAARLLRQRIRIPDLVQTPDSWSAVQADFDRWRKNYELAYKKHLRDYFADANAVRTRLPEVKLRLDVLDNLVGSKGVAGGETAALRSHLDDLSRRLPTEAYEPKRVQVGPSPVCAFYGIPLDARRLGVGLAALEAEIGRALDHRLASLRGETVRILLAEKTTPIAREFAASLQEPDGQALLRLLATQGSAKFALSLLQSIATKRVNLVEKLQPQFPTVTRQNLDAAVGAFRATLLSQIEAAEREHGGRVTVEITLD